MTSLLDVVNGVENEINMADQCLANILARLDEDIARINERKAQITEEFAARRRSLEELIGASVGYAPAPAAHEAKVEEDSDER
jgi:septal ring factor EnvC (AmiA/AmiB activator)